MTALLRALSVPHADLVAACAGVAGIVVVAVAWRSRRWVW